MENTIFIPASSRTVYEPLMRHMDYLALSPALSQKSVELQSASVTSIGSLWQRALTDLVEVDLLLASAYGSIKTEVDRSAKQVQSKPPFIQLLKSWLEEDEQEQRDTWEYLKRALDEDRLSDRKLFP